MKKTLLTMAVMGSLLVVSQAQAGASANIGVTSDYIWRGVTQTDEGAAVQAGLDYEADNGYDLNLGQDPDVIGHAANFFDAPNRQYRITGAYNGQECYDYKLLHHIGDTPWNIIYSIDMDDACHFSHQFWTDTSHFYYSVMQPQGNETVMRYYQLSITSLK